MLTTSVLESRIYPLRPGSSHGDHRYRGPQRRSTLLRSVLRGLDDDALVIAGSKPATARELGALLSGREREVFHHAALGAGNKEIADRLRISEATVKAHLTRIFYKLRVSGRGERQEDAYLELETSS